MSQHDATVTCIGLANVDVIATVTDDFLDSHNMTKAATTKLDAATVGIILGKLNNPEFYPGGCAANTACGLSNLGIDTAFCGKTGDDTYADIFKNGFADNNVRFIQRPYAQKMTSTCLTLVTPDKDRSFAICSDTAGWFLTKDDLPDIAEPANKTVYLEANTALMDEDTDRNLLLDAVDKYQSQGATIIINLNDKKIVQNSLKTLKSVLERDTGFLIGNIAEFHTLFDTQTQDEVFQKAIDSGQKFAITDGPNGACIIHDGDMLHVPAQKLHTSRIVNTVGAGDQFAAGFVAGLVRGLSYEDACRSGIDAATKIIQLVSARPSDKTAKKNTAHNF